MPITTWREINDIMHNVKLTLYKMIEIEKKCKKIKTDAIKQMNEIEEHCKVVKDEAMIELETINTIILQYLDEEEEKNVKS